LQIDPRPPPQGRKLWKIDGDSKGFAGPLGEQGAKQRARPKAMAAQRVDIGAEAGFVADFA
jgi:hypothetical protein